jgi:hypothetical protein
LSWFQSSKSLCLDLFPRHDIIRRFIVFRHSPLKFSSLSISQQCWLRLRSDGIPDIMDKGQPLIAWKLIDAQGLDSWNHC